MSTTNAFAKFEYHRGRASAAREPGQPGPPNAVHACPQARLDAPIGGTLVQSPAAYQDSSMGNCINFPVMQLVCHRSTLSPMLG